MTRHYARTLIAAALCLPVAAVAQTAAEAYTAARTEVQLAQDKLTAAGNVFLRSQLQTVADLKSTIDQIKVGADANFNSTRTLIDTVIVRLNALESQAAEQGKTNATMLARLDAIINAIAAIPQSQPAALTDDQFRTLFVAMVNARLAIAP